MNITVQSEYANIKTIMQRKLREKGVKEFPDTNIRLDVTPEIGSEGFTITDDPDGGIAILGNDQRGLLYGAGKFLRDSKYQNGVFVPGKWRGKSIPDCPLRGIYCAVHFHNFYEDAPDEKIANYLEDLALWGMNYVSLIFPAMQYTGFDDPEAVRNIALLRKLFSTAKNIGMKIGTFIAPNVGFNTAPESMYYEVFPDDLGRRGYLGTLLCPSKPETRQYLVDLYTQYFSQFTDIGLDFLLTWPYDEGGCGCSECWPWGAKGFLSISHEIRDIFCRIYPQGEFMLSTWMYDTPPVGEWDGLRESLEKDNSWIDYIMADAHEDYPRYPLDNPVPGNLPLINFPEISMWGLYPWGGYGASTLPKRFQRLWDQVSDRISGGFPYSEGIFEDINKAIYLQFYWKRDRTTEDIVKEYISSEFSPKITDIMLEAVRLFEENHVRTEIGESAVEEYELLRKADALLSDEAKQSWRWRILYLRAQIDSELYKNNGKIAGSVIEKAFDELTNIYHAQNAWERVRPPMIEE